MIACDIYPHSFYRRCSAFGAAILCHAVVIDSGGTQHSLVIPNEHMTGDGFIHARLVSGKGPRPGGTVQVVVPTVGKPTRLVLREWQICRYGEEYQAETRDLRRA